jgi:pterin-4a-carbinolamine dehydratase
MIRSFRSFASESIEESGWIESADGLAKEIVFGTQTELAEFLLKAARLADEIGHHPDAEIFEAAKLRLTLITHSENAVTDLDRRLARLIDSI